MGCAIDHVFVFVEPGGAELAYLASLGLVETYRRTHAGQGTQNICFCFDNLFIECLWVCDTSAIRSPAVARTRLYERSQWRTAGTCPFGFAWRIFGDDCAFDPPVWAYRPAYLPDGMAIDVSVDGDDPRQPMMFRSPSGAPPSAWAPERRGNLQHAAGLGRVLALRLALPRGIARQSRTGGFGGCNAPGHPAGSRRDAPADMRDRTARPEHTAEDNSSRKPATRPPAAEFRRPSKAAAVKAEIVLEAS